MNLWNAVKRPPTQYLKTIMGGRLRGMTDISPIFRYEILTDQFGPCGIGWKYEIVRTWTEDAPEGQMFVFAEINLYIKEKEWSEPIPGIGGSMLIAKEKSGLYPSDEGYKMAITDALSVACKMLGVGADIYAGMWDGSKYADEPTCISADELKDLKKKIKEVKADEEKFLSYMGISSLEEMPKSMFKKAMTALSAKKAKLADREGLISKEQIKVLSALAAGFGWNMDELNHQVKKTYGRGDFLTMKESEAKDMIDKLEKSKAAKDEQS